MELDELARRALPVNVALLALLAFSALGIEFTSAEASAATYYVMYFSLAFLALNFVIIYAVYRYRIE